MRKSGPTPSIVILAPNWLGDAVMALPAIADVRRRFAGSRVTVAARPSVAGLFAMVPAVDEVIELEWKGRALRVSEMERDVVRLREAGADVALLLPNSFAAAWLASRAGIPERWGFAGDLRTPLLTRAIPKPADSVHQAVYYQTLLRALDIASGPLDACLAVPEASIDEARRLLRESGWDGTRPVVALAPGAAYGTAKRWPPGHFARVASDLIATHGAQCVMVGGGADAYTVQAVCELLSARDRAHVVDLCGRTTLATLAGVLRLSRACVSNDSGAMHVASAVGVPLAALFGPTNERETAPLARTGVDTHVLIHHVACRPCMLRECPIDHPCMRDLEPSRVLSVVAPMLSTPNPESRTPSPESRT